jgi:TrpR-related protein YerC/YecD
MERRMAARQRTTQRTTTRAATTAEHAVEPVAGLDELVDALLTMRDRNETMRFLRDLCTLPELEALAHRWQIARLVDEGVPYLEIAGRVPSSTATVTRVAQWVRHGAGGYRLALERAQGER